MRAKEFINEASKGKIAHIDQKPSKGINTYSDAEFWNSDYVAYRLGMAVACTDGKVEPWMPATSWIGKSKATFPYTKEEQEMLKKAYKAVGANYQDVNKGDMESKELESTDTVSPVAKFKPTKKAKR